MHRLTFHFLLLGLFLVLLGGCTKTYSDQDVHWLSVKNAEAAIQEQEGSWFSQPRPNAWIDARDEVFYKVGHIPGALNIQLSDPDAFTRLTGYGTLVVYGEGYEAPIADAMIKALLKGGMESVKGLQGGYEAWIEAGQKVVKGPDPSRRPGAIAGDRWQRQPVDDD
ncbi:MAG: rhodanese-like domain-containing protein [Phycisphaerales bacterium]|nr:rhodanese-like domain-containing protein [Phycisphaerales bacterium]